MVESSRSADRMDEVKDRKSLRKWLVGALAAVGLLGTSGCSDAQNNQANDEPVQVASNDDNPFLTQASADARPSLAELREQAEAELAEQRERTAAAQDRAAAAQDRAAAAERALEIVDEDEDSPSN